MNQEEREVGVKSDTEIRPLETMHTFELRREPTFRVPLTRQALTSGNKRSPLPKIIIIKEL